MQDHTKQTGLLSPFRALDLTDEKGALCGKMLGDLGCDVIKIEKPGGDASRDIGPFYHDRRDRESSLFWFAFNNNKRGITLDIEKPEGKGLFRRLAKTTDFIIESFDPGYLDKLGLGYREMEKLNPRLIMVSITPFGQTGPYRDYKTADIVSWGMGGYMYVYGDDDRPPLRISHHSHAYMHASAEAAGAAMLSLYYREIKGHGQHIDVSIHESVARLDMTLRWDMTRVINRRALPPGMEKRRVKGYIWQCKDGFMLWVYWTGAQATAWSMGFVRWLTEEGMLDDYLKNFPWETVDTSKLEGVKAVEEALLRIEEPTLRFFSTRTKAVLEEEGKKRGLMLYPIADSKDVMSSRQLDARNFWQELDHPELGEKITYPGPYANMSQEGLTPGLTRRAPLIGEHNNEVYECLGVGTAELVKLKEKGIV